METASTYRERAGVVTAQIIIFATLFFGFGVPVLAAWWGKPIVIDSDFKAMMSVLAAGAFAYLIGKQTTNGPSVTASLGAGDGSASATVVGQGGKPTAGA